jgi:hypothetical protein
VYPPFSNKNFEFGVFISMTSDLPSHDTPAMDWAFSFTRRLYYLNLNDVQGPRGPKPMTNDQKTKKDQRTKTKEQRPSLILIA